MLANDPVLQKLWLRATQPVSIESEPSRADVFIQPYPAHTTAWERIGATPLMKERVAKGAFVWRIAKTGFASVSFINVPVAGEYLETKLTLRPERRVPAEGEALPAVA